jgi:hypothetical protein
MKRLNIPIIVRTADHFLQNNFDEVLQRLFNEVFSWQRFGQPIPSFVMEVCSQEEKFRVLRENVLLVVRGRWWNLLQLIWTRLQQHPEGIITRREEIISREGGVFGRKDQTRSD